MDANGELMQPKIQKVPSPYVLDLGPAVGSRKGFELRYVGGRSEELALKPGEWLSNFEIENNRGPVHFGFHPVKGLIFATEADARIPQGVLRSGGIMTEIVPTGGSCLPAGT
jgi:hypothetical protein